MPFRASRRRQAGRRNSTDDIQPMHQRHQHRRQAIAEWLVVGEVVQPPLQPGLVDEQAAWTGR